MKEIKEVAKPNRQLLVNQKDLSAAVIPLLVLIVIMALYFMYG